MTPSEILMKHEDANEYHFHEVDRKWIIEAMEEYATSPQTEISDKVLFEQATVAMEERYGSGCEEEIDAYFRGAKWMINKIQGGNK
jgi:hypothetical protein